jgi:hypothetical protein
MEDSKNVNEESKSKSSASSEKEAEKVDNDVEVVTNQPGVGIKMGRFPEQATCPWCGASGLTATKYRRGAKAMCCCCCVNFWNPWVYGTGFSCMIGWPACSKVNYWDVEHFCQNCTRKIGFNVLRDKFCCWLSDETKRMPQN